MAPRGPVEMPADGCYDDGQLLWKEMSLFKKCTILEKT